MIDIENAIDNVIETIGEVRADLTTSARGKTTEQQNIICSADDGLINALAHLESAKKYASELGI